mmetsp:Transcript_5/g.13  ORF Transcript_5/g.13 Transcript_5/m.13 type:complete len:241 (+) Transcript_5:106-828(+)
MLLSRLAFISTSIMIMSSTSLCFQFLFPHHEIRSIQQKQQPPLIASYHEPPPLQSDSNNENSDLTKNDDYYTNNPSVFGRILAGEIPSRTYLESTELLAFQDRLPKAPFHALVIPKQFVKSVYSLRGNTRYSDGERENKSQDKNDIHLIQNMRQMGLDLLEQQQPEALATEDYILCFHIPPFNSVDHLHLHVLAPASEMNWVYREIKYKCGARWCTSDLEVIERLMAGLPAVRYKHPFQC